MPAEDYGSKLVVDVSSGQERLIPLTPAEVAARDALMAEAALKAARQTAIQASINDIDLRWSQYAVLKGKTPAEIYALMQGAMDAWVSLADARADLREWLPLMAAAIAWMVMRDAHTEP